MQYQGANGQCFYVSLNPMFEPHGYLGCSSFFSRIPSNIQFECLQWLPLTISGLPHIRAGLNQRRASLGIQLDGLRLLRSGPFSLQKVEKLLGASPETPWGDCSTPSFGSTTPVAWRHVVTICTSISRSRVSKCIV